MKNRNQFHVPEDIVSYILLRLVKSSRFSVKSLLRFRTVCKSWLSIISDPQFIKSHYLIAAQKKPCILMNETLSSTPKDFTYIFLPKLFTSRYRRFIGCYNGIVCLTDDSGGDIYLWNPSTKQYKTVPEPKHYRNLYGGRCIGFGYDSVYDDYKILCLEFQKGYNGCVDRERVQLFSVKSGFWREIVVNITLPKNNYANGPVINGILYFEIMDVNSYRPEAKNELISFNLHNEEFGIVQLPFNVFKRASKLFDFEGSLAILTRSGALFDVWTLENTSEMPWIEKFSIELPLISESWTCGETSIELYLGKGQFYASHCSQNWPPEFDNSSLMWCNYKTKHGNYFDLQCGVQSPLVLKYTESLVSLQGFESTGPVKSRHSRNSSIKQGYQAKAQSRYPGYPTQPTSGGSYATTDRFTEAPYELKKASRRRKKMKAMQ